MTRTGIDAVNQPMIEEEEEEEKLAQEGLDYDPIQLMVTITNNDSCNSEGWLLNIGCYNHITRHKEYMKGIDTGR